MTLLSLIFALLIEQVRPLSAQRVVVAPLQRLADGLAERYNNGQATSGRVAWCLLVLAAVLLTGGLYHVLWSMHVVLAFAFNVAILYLTLGFRHESHFFTDIHLALRMGELDRARVLLGEWRGGSYREAGAKEVARLAIEQALVASHRNVFGVAFWFVVLPGPCGAVMYRLARFLSAAWGARDIAETGRFGEFGDFAKQAYAWIDWLPQRLTAISFSIVGNFEDAVYCWRAQAVLWRDKASAILLASGAGALGVRLGMPVHESGEVVDRPELGVGDEADVDDMQATVGLVWRALVLCLLMLALVTIAGWVGR